MSVYMGHNCWLGTLDKYPEYCDFMTDWIVEHQIPMLYNAHFDWDGEEFDDFDTLPVPTVVDSGGFHSLREHGEYPWSVEEYHQAVADVDATYDWVAPMDYPSPELADDYRRKTFENVVRQTDLADYHVIPVLQGETPAEYVEMYDWYRDAGIDVSKIGVGGLVPIRAPTTVRDISYEVADAVASGTELHGFGIKFRELKHGAVFDTVDTATWTYYYSNGKRLVYDGDTSKLSHESYEDYPQAIVDCFYAYYCYLKQQLTGRVVDIPRPVI